MVFDAPVDLLGLLNPLSGCLHPARFELLQAPLDALGQAFQDPGFVRIPDSRLLHRRVRRQGRAVREMQLLGGSEEHSGDCALARRP
jgi:hypothetical protein